MSSVMVPTAMFQHLLRASNIAAGNASYPNSSPLWANCRIRKNPFYPPAKTATLLKLPVELRLIIYEHLFSMAQFSIHIHDDECAGFCGPRRSQYTNLAIMLVNRQLSDESKSYFATHGTFHIFKTAFHGHMALPTLPTAATTNVRRLVCWSDVALRVFTDRRGMSIVGPIVNLKFVAFKLIWNAQRRMTPDVKAFIVKAVNYTWTIDIEKYHARGLVYRVKIYSDKRVVIADRKWDVPDYTIDTFLQSLGLSYSSVTNA